jgi:hypothetical protein
VKNVSFVVGGGTTYGVPTPYHPEAGTAPPAPVRTSTVLLGARTGRNPGSNRISHFIDLTYFLLVI